MIIDIVASMTIYVMVIIWFGLKSRSQSTKLSVQNYASKPEQIIEMVKGCSTLVFIQHNALELFVAYKSG